MWVGRLPLNPQSFSAISWPGVGGELQLCNSFLLIKPVAYVVDCATGISLFAFRNHPRWGSEAPSRTPLNALTSPPPPTRSRPWPPSRKYSVNISLSPPSRIPLLRSKLPARNCALASQVLQDCSKSDGLTAQDAMWLLNTYARILFPCLYWGHPEHRKRRPMVIRWTGDTWHHWSLVRRGNRTLFLSLLQLSFNWYHREKAETNHYYKRSD